MSLVDKLRDEIIESQKAQAAFTRWKLLLVAGFGAASLGALPNGHVSIRSLALLCLLPFVCLYVDTLCYHSGIRVLTIARYLRVDASIPVGASDDNCNLTDLTAVRDYEVFCARNRHRFGLEGVALLSVSIIASAVVALIGISIWLAPLLISRPYPPGASTASRLTLTVLLVSSGILGGVLAKALYDRHCNKVDSLDTV